MPALALLAGLVLIAVGVGTYVATGAHAPTALIPAAIGVLIAAAGLLARIARLRMHAMHVAVLVALLGGLICVWKLAALAVTGPSRPVAMAEQGITAVVCLAFVVSAVRSFREARRSRASAG